MLPRRFARPILLFSALAIAALVVFAACGGGEETAKATPSGSQSPAATKIDVSGVTELQDKKLTVGSDIAYAPIEFLEAGTQNAVGLDIDIANAMGKLLGVDVEFLQVSSFEGIVGDLQAKRYDMIMSAITINEKRQKEIDFIAYFDAGTGILVPKGNPKGLKTFDDLCGLKVAAQLGTVQVDQMNAANDGTCKDKKIDVKTFPDNPFAVQELKLGRADAELADFPVAAYDAKQSDGKLEVLSTQFEAAPYGIGVRKDSTKLKTVLEKAFSAIRADGTYANILAKWGLQAGKLAQ